MKKITLLVGIGLILAMLLVPITLAAVNVTGNVNNKAPNITSTQICDGTCAGTKSVNPGTQFTVRLVVNDPNGSADLNTDAFWLEVYQSADNNGDAADWDHITLTDLSSASADGCDDTAPNVYCVTVQASDWSTKFIASSVGGGAADIYARAYDNASVYGSAESTGVLTVNDAVGTSQDQTDVSYTGDPNSTDNAMSPASIVTTHEGNVDINVSVTASNLVKGIDSIAATQMHWDLNNTVASTTNFTGGSDVVQTDLNRGAAPTSNTFNLYTWLDIPDGTPAGAYTGTFTFSSVAS